MKLGSFVWWFVGFILFIVSLYVLMKLQLLGESFVLKSFFYVIIGVFLLLIIVFLVFHFVLKKRYERITNPPVEVVDQDMVEKILRYRLVERYLPNNVNPFNIPRGDWLRPDKPPLVLWGDEPSLSLGFPSLHAHKGTGKQLLSVRATILGSMDEGVNGSHFFHLTIDEGVDWLWHNSFGLVEEVTGGFHSSMFGKPVLHTSKSAIDKRINALISKGVLTSEEFDYSSFITKDNKDSGVVPVVQVESGASLEPPSNELSREEQGLKDDIEKARGGDE